MHFSHNCFAFAMQHSYYSIAHFNAFILPCIVQYKVIARYNGHSMDSVVVQTINTYLLTSRGHRLHNSNILNHQQIELLPIICRIKNDKQLAKCSVTSC